MHVLVLLQQPSLKHDAVCVDYWPITIKELLHHTVVANFCQYSPNSIDLLITGPLKSVLGCCKSLMLQALCHSAAPHACRPPLAHHRMHKGRIYSMFVYV